MESGMGALAVAGTEAPGSGGRHAHLLRVVHERTGLALEAYKARFIERRVAIRVRATRHERLEDYLRFLASDRDELERLLHCLTINVSSFFRNPTTYDAIRVLVFPQLFAPGAPRRVRLWSVGCARGEEPYSLAMLAHEFLGEQRARWDLRIDAIDVDTRVLEDAKRGEYGWPQVAELDGTRRERFFSHDGRWRVVPEIRRAVRFARRDILMDPPGGEYDFIVCRNLLIYLDRAGQEAVLGRLARCLRPGGFLALGRTEAAVGASRAAFEIIDARERIYRRLPAAGPAAPEPAHRGRT